MKGEGKALCQFYVYGFGTFNNLEHTVAFSITSVSNQSHIEIVNHVYDKT